MASQASSEMPSAGRPGSSGSRGVPVLPRLGTTWYDRGPRYWLRRVWSGVVLVLVVAAFCFFAVELYRGFTEQWPSALRTAWNTVQVVGGCGALVWGWVKQRREHRREMLDPPAPARARLVRRRQARRNVALVFALRGVVLLAAPVMPAVAAYVVGWSAAWLTVREYPAEAGARRAVAE
ncbi:hypothetical protein [Streptomyces sp. NPDC008150]|uniref:hypothetical protein n=1 Tax=Streptomyces sp. NPDC008150 TaxID=3364816 RepID=UPI0036E12BAA